MLLLSTSSRHPCLLLHQHRQQRHKQAARRLSKPVSAAPPTASPPTEVDFVVCGCGIIGLLVTRQLLLAQPELSVALFDAKQPCAGATGAGQGYIWMAHRDPASPGWALAARSKALWEQLAGAAGNGGSNGQQQQHATPPPPAAAAALQEALEWQTNGSLLLATTDAEVQQLQQRAAMLQEQGIAGVVLLSPRELQMLEPALQLPPGSRGLLVKSDAQINGKRTAFALMEECQRLGAAAAPTTPAGGSSSSNTSSSSRLLVGLQEGVDQLVPLEPPSAGQGAGGGGVEVVTSANRRVRARRGVVVAAGVWSGQLLSAATGQSAWRDLLQPRRGHLLEMDLPQGMPHIHTGMMELSYTQHYSTGTTGATAGGPPHADALSSTPSSSHSPVDITFTATASAGGSLLIGSSREFSGWESVPSEAIIDAILQRASVFLPHLATVTSADVMQSTRVGLRPYAVGGLPAVGPVPSLPGVFVAAGHEGSGLCLGPATAELVVHYLLGGGERSLHQELLDAAEALLPEKRLASVASATAL